VRVSRLFHRSGRPSAVALPLTTAVVQATRSAGTLAAMSIASHNQARRALLHDCRCRIAGLHVRPACSILPISPNPSASSNRSDRCCVIVRVSRPGLETQGFGGSEIVSIQADGRILDIVLAARRFGRSRFTRAAQPRFICRRHSPPTAATAIPARARTEGSGTTERSPVALVNVKSCPPNDPVHTPADSASDPA
jgi:hypothetical protein